MKKKILLIGAVLVMLLTFAGCGSGPKEAVTVEEFLQTAEEHEFNFKEYTNNFKDVEVIDEVYQGHYLGTCWIEFYVFTDTAYAKEGADNLIEDLKTSFTGSSGVKKVSKEGENYTTYLVKNGEVSYYVSQVDSTVLRVEVNDLDYTDTINAFIDALGY